MVIGREDGIVDAVPARGLSRKLSFGCFNRVHLSGRQEEIAPVDQYRLMAEASDAVLNGNPVPLSPADSIANMRVLDAIAASAKLGEASGCGF